MSEIPKYELGTEAKIATMIDNHKEETLFYADNKVYDEVYSAGLGIALFLELYDCNKSSPIRMKIIMDEKQAKGVIKALNMQIKNLRRL